MHTVLKHPLVDHRVTLMRDQATPPKLFRELVNEITEFLGKYMGEEIVEEMTFVDLIEVFNFWKLANEQVGGLSLGE